MAFTGGLIGSYFMDIAESYLSKTSINSGVTGTHIAKWLHGLVNGRFYHNDIDAAVPVNHGALIAGLFHYIIGGGVVALGYAALVSMLHVPSLAWHIPLSLLFGLLTCVLPWLILMPAIGKGVFGHKMPADKKPLLAPILSHIAYGLGIGITLIFYGVLST